jgi:DNA-binding response OmpR family regulator
MGAYLTAARLRRKIGPGVIQTRRGHGYILETAAP